MFLFLVRSFLGRGFSDQGRFRVFLTMGNQGGAGGDQNVGNAAVVEFLELAAEAPLTDRD